jgi:hypothetical protein
LISLPDWNIWVIYNKSCDNWIIRKSHDSIPVIPEFLSIMSTHRPIICSKNLQIYCNLPEIRDLYHKYLLTNNSLSKGRFRWVFEEYKIKSTSFLYQYKFKATFFDIIDVIVFNVMNNLTSWSFGMSHNVEFYRHIYYRFLNLVKTQNRNIYFMCENTKFLH